MLIDAILDRRDGEEYKAAVYLPTYWKKARYSPFIGT